MKNILGYRNFILPEKIRETIKKSKNYSAENIDETQLFYFFETSKQRTWLVATDLRVYIILDDIRKENIKVNASYRIDTIYQSDKLNIRIDPNYKDFYGRIFFSEAKIGWLYSKKLFREKERLSEKVESTIKKACKIMDKQKATPTSEEDIKLLEGSA